MQTPDVDPQCRELIDRSDRDEVIVQVFFTDGQTRSQLVSFVDFDRFIATITTPEYARELRKQSGTLVNPETREPIPFAPLFHGRRWVVTLREGTMTTFEHRMMSSAPANPRLSS